MIKSEKISTVIIDDEYFAREILKSLLDSNCPELEVVAQATDVKSAIQIINNLKPELLFLDVRLSNDNSFEILNELDYNDYEIIFTSGHGQYGVDAFKVNAVDFILKPIDVDDLTSAVQKLITKRKNKSLIENSSKTLTVHINDKVKIISSSEIIRLLAQKNYTEIYTTDNTKYLVPKTLSDIHLHFSELSQFIRVKKCSVINAKYIQSYSKVDPFNIVMIDGCEIEISRRRRSEVLSFLKNN